MDGWTGAVCQHPDSNHYCVGPHIPIALAKRSYSYVSQRTKFPAGADLIRDAFKKQDIKTRFIAILGKL
jgi:hypothetical protein